MYQESKSENLHPIASNLYFFSLISGWNQKIVRMLHNMINQQNLQLTIFANGEIRGVNKYCSRDINIFNNLYT